MTNEQQSILLGEFYAEKKNILKLKGEDYANEDVLSNFKTAGANIGISAELQCLSLIATKVARLGNLLSGKTPNNESISDSIIDLSNYTDLLYCLVNEQITDDLKIVKENILKKQQDIVRDFEMKPNNLLDEKYRLHEPTTKRWENIAPNPMLDAIKGLYKTTLAGAEWHKNRREKDVMEKSELIKNASDVLRTVDDIVGHEPINECCETRTKRWENVKPKGIIQALKEEFYKPQVGDRFENENGIIINLKRVYSDFLVFQYKQNGDLIISVLWLTDFLNEIKLGKLKKIN